MSSNPLETRNLALLAILVAFLVVTVVLAVNRPDGQMTGVMAGILILSATAIIASVMRGLDK